MKRCACRVVMFLLLGAIVNVAVAWATGVLFYDGSRVDCLIEAESGEPSELANVAVCIADTWAGTRADVFREFDRDGNFREVADLTIEVPYWMHQFASSRAFAENRWQQYAVYSSGLPLRSLAGCMRIDLNSEPYSLEADWVIILPPSQPFRNDQSRLLPLSPLWPGFAINTILYAAILWMVFAFPFTLRRRRRTRHGLCPACAYPVGTSEVCTECGKAVQPRPGRGDGL